MKCCKSMLFQVIAITQLALLLEFFTVLREFLPHSSKNFNNVSQERVVVRWAGKVGERRKVKKSISWKRGGGFSVEEERPGIDRTRGSTMGRESGRKGESQ